MKKKLKNIFKLLTIFFLISSFVLQNIVCTYSSNTIIQKTIKNTKNIIPIVEEHNDYFEKSEIYMLHSVTGAQCLSMIIKDPENNIFVFDGGWREDKNYFLQKIKSLGGIVQAWFITHDDADHVGCLNAVLEDPNPGIFICNVFKEPYMPLDLIFGRTRIVLLNNPYFCLEDTTNNSSRVYKVFLENKSILIPGDLAIEGANNLIRNISDINLLKSDFLQMPHHGAHYTMREFYALVSPTVCLWPTYNGSYLKNEKVMKTKQIMQGLKVKDNFYIDNEDIVIK